MRKLRGPLADWDTSTFLLRNIEFHVRAANWQRAGGKGQKPKPIELPDSKGRGSKPVAGKASDADTARRLQNLGMIPAGTNISG